MLSTEQLLQKVKNGEISVEEALLELKKAPFEDIGFAKVDLHRKVRQGAAEVICGAGKTAEQITAIADTMIKNGQTTILITRLSEESAIEIQKKHSLKYDKMSKTGIIGVLPKKDGIGNSIMKGAPSFLSFQAGLPSNLSPSGEVRVLRGYDLSQPERWRPPHWPCTIHRYLCARVHDL